MSHPLFEKRCAPTTARQSAPTRIILKCVGTDLTNFQGERNHEVQGGRTRVPNALSQVQSIAEQGAPNLCRTHCHRACHG